MAMRLIWFALPALALAAAGCGGFTKAGGTSRHTVVLTIANHETGDRDLKEYISAVSRLSDGSITFELEGGWRAQDIDYDRGTVADVGAGKVDLAKVAVRSFDELGVDDFQAVTAPLLVDGLALERKLLASRLPNKMLPAIHRLGIEGLAMLPGELRRPFGLTRRLLKPSDYPGAVFGITPSLLSARTFRALGATPRGYLSRELPPFVFDGAELDLVTLERDGYDINGSSITANVAFWPKAFSVVANRMMLAKLTAAQRNILRRAGREALGAAIARLHNKDRVEAGILCRRGRVTFVTATPPQLAALRAAVRPVYAPARARPENGVVHSRDRGDEAWVASGPGGSMLRASASSEHAVSERKHCCDAARRHLGDDGEPCRSRRRRRGSLPHGLEARTPARDTSVEEHGHVQPPR